MNSIKTYNEFINEEFFGFLTKKSSEDIRMKSGQIVCVQSDIARIIHVYQMINPRKNEAIFIGNLKQSNTSWVFKLTTPLKKDLVIIENYRELEPKERKIVQWYLSDKIEDIKNVTDFYPKF